MTIYQLACEDEQTNLYNVLLNPSEKETQVTFSCHLRRGGYNSKTPCYELVHFVGYFSKYSLQNASLFYGKKHVQAKALSVAKVALIFTIPMFNTTHKQ